MIIKIIRADGEIEINESTNYVIGEIKDFHPLICKVDVYSNDGKKIASRHRPFSFFYKHFTFKSSDVQFKLRQILSSQEKKNESE